MNMLQDNLITVVNCKTIIPVETSRMSYEDMAFLFAF